MINIKSFIYNIFRKIFRKELKIFQGDRFFAIKFKGKLFAIDNIDYDFFMKKFNVRPYKLIIKSSVYKNGKENYYLARKSDFSNKIDYFHIMVMEKEIKEFCLSRGCPRSEVIVHHIGNNSRINTRDNLKVMTRKEHDRIHGRLENDNLIQKKLV